MTPKFGVEHRGLLLDRVVPMLSAPLRHRLHTSPKALAESPDVNREPPRSAARTHVRETEEVEGRWLRRVGMTRECRASERDEPRLLRVKCQPILGESLGQHGQDSLRILPVLKTEYE